MTAHCLKPPVIHFHLFHKYLLSICYTSGLVLGAENLAIKKEILHFGGRDRQEKRGKEKDKR
jgi:hypothetical protein